MSTGVQMASERHPLIHHPLLPSDHHHYVNAVVSSGRTARHQTKRYLTSKVGHYNVLVLVSLDVLSIFADFLISLLACEDRVGAHDAETAHEVLEIVGLIFSSLFLLELIASVWAFGGTFFKSWFRCFDALVILVSFMFDVVLKGVLEEIGSLVIILRLFRVVKIIDELSAGAEEQMEPLLEKIEDLERETRSLKSELDDLKQQSTRSS